jgi:predicted amidohydrolase YtcJ
MKTASWWIVVLSASALVAFAQAPRSSGVSLYEGARLIDGRGRPPIEKSALLVENGHIAAVGPQGDVKAPAGATRVDLSGKTLMPAMINVHVHIGYEGYASWGAENYTPQNVLDHLQREAFYGVGVTQSVGSSPTEASIHPNATRPPAVRAGRVSSSCPAWRRPTVALTPCC